MGEKLKNILVGVFVIIACVLLVSLILFLKPKVGDGKETVYARFTNINGISVGTRVLFAGRPIGEVSAITVVKDAREEKTDSLGQVYYYQLTLRIDSSVKVYSTDEISLETSGLLGEKSVAITPRVPPKGITPKLIKDQPVYGESMDPIQSAFIELSTLANSMEITFEEITLWIQRYGQAMGNAIQSAGDTLDEMKVAVKNFNDLGILSDVKNTTTHLSATMEQVHNTITEMQENQVFTNICKVMQNAQTITSDISEGKGTVGKLITDPDLYLKVMDIMGKGNTLMNDINNYGILFHLNKQWQRQRLQRADFLTALSTPDKFKNYFESEVDQINIAMTRLSTLLDKAEQPLQKERIMQSDSFKRDFADLMRRADELSDHLRTFNEELTEHMKQGS